MQQFRPLFFVVCASVLLAGCGSGEEENNKGPEHNFDRRNWSLSRTFTAEGETFAPADFEAVQLNYVFSPKDQTATGTAEIDFRATESGKAFFLSEPTLANAQIDGHAVEIKNKNDPDNLNTLKVISHNLKKGTRYHLSLNFALPSSRISFESGGVGFLTSMSDMGRGNYLEAYAPASFEGDSFTLRMNLKISGDPIPAHSLFSNGESKKISETEWILNFPPHFTSSSFYVHLTNGAFFVKQGTYAGKKANIPLTVYSRDNALAESALKNLPSIFAELESTYGPYAHESFVAYISGRGGMEYSGATITSNSALGHELTHSWFARGVMPAGGSSGWIDEAIASWRDFGYFRATSTGIRTPTNLGRFSAFDRFTPTNCYVDGRALLAEFDLLMAPNGGLKPLLAELFLQWDHHSIRTEDFKEFLEKKSGLDLTSLFQKYVYDADSAFPGDSDVRPMDRLENEFHPLLSQKEIESLR